MKNKKILIATGIYPPAIGGPAEYAKNIEDAWKGMGYHVIVKFFSFEHKIPAGIRHLYFLMRSLYSIWRSDFIIVLDTFSVALPIAIGCKIFGKRFVVRTGGDFLWESYVERTSKKVLFKNFYSESINDLNQKEKNIIKITKWILKRADEVIFSTEWQRDVWKKPYNLDVSKTRIIENYYGDHMTNCGYKSKVFMGATRNLVWKNQDVLHSVFDDREIIDAGISLNLGVTSHSKFIDNIKASYAVILVSIGDISPNMIMDSISLNKPFVVTREVGIYDRIKEIALFVDPLNPADIKDKILWLNNPSNYDMQVDKIKNFSFRHSWGDIAREILNSNI